MKILAVLVIALWGWGALANISTLSFGSCLHQDRPMPILDVIAAGNPEVFLFLGDNVYADTEDMSVMRAKYQELGHNPSFQNLISGSDIYATWDDHDFGYNDVGREYAFKRESEQIFLDFWNVPQDSPRRKREGVYGAYEYGPIDQRVQILLLDTRYFRDALTAAPKDHPLKWRYIPNTDPNLTMLGEEQWAWLEGQLRKPARIRIIASSLEVLGEWHGWEKWYNMPTERQRLFDLIRETNAGGVLFLSGDRHSAFLARKADSEVPYPIYDFTSSSLNGALPDQWRTGEPNRYRLGDQNWVENFGQIHFEWWANQLTLELRDADGSLIEQRIVPFAEIGAL